MRFHCCTLPKKFFCCHLNVAGIVIGWLGATYRIFTLVIFAILLSRTTEFDPVLFDIIFSAIVTLAAVNLVGNILLLYGIYVKKPLFMLPYLSTEVFEILLLIIVFLFLSFLNYFMNPQTLRWLIPLAILVLSFYIYFYVCMVNLYIGYREQQQEIGRDDESIVVYTIRADTMLHA